MSKNNFFPKATIAAAKPGWSFPRKRLINKIKMQVGNYFLNCNFSTASRCSLNHYYCLGLPELSMLNMADRYAGLDQNCPS